MTEDIIVVLAALCRKRAAGELEEEEAESGEVAGMKAEVEEAKRRVAMVATAVPLLLVVVGVVMALLVVAVPVVVVCLFVLGNE